MNTLNIIMTTFNEDSSLLKKSLDSVVCQTYNDFQLILVIEPGDINIQFINEYALDNDKIVVFENEQKLGFVASLNKGIKSSTVKYIARLDSDDICHPERLEQQVRYLEENQDIDVLGTWMSYNDADSTVRQYPEFHDDIKKGFLLNSSIAHPTVVLKRALFVEYGYYDESFIYSEDLELWLRFLGNGCKFHNLQKSLLTYSVDRGSERPKASRVFGYQARVLHNRKIYSFAVAILGIFIHRLLSIMPDRLFVVIKRIMSKKINNLNKG